MEAIVLAVTPQTSSTAVSQNDSSMDGANSSFAPLLTQAISEKENETDIPESSASSSGDVSLMTMAYQLLNLQPSPVEDDAEQIGIHLGTESSQPNAFSALDLLLNTLQTDGKIASDIRDMLTGRGDQVKTNPLIAQYMATLAQEKSTESDFSPLTSIPALTAVSHDSTEFLPGRIGTDQSVPKGPYAPNQELSLLLSQLHEIINSNEAKGAVVVRQPETIISLDDLKNLTPQVNKAVAGALEVQTAPTASASVETAAAGGIITANSQTIVPTETTPQPSSNKTQPLRQDIQQQYLDGTINLKEDGTKKDTNGQSGQQDNSNNSQSSPSSAGAFSALQGDEAGQSTLFSLANQEIGSSQQLTQPGKTITLPSGTMVTEQQIFDQIVQRFHLTNRMQSTRINLKLHPAELGELKIDLTIKEGSIKANVYAQSQHVQEILEKNMPKLRTILEQQGFVIEDIVVSSKSETIANFDLFGGQLPNRQTFTSSENKTLPPSTFAAAFDSTLTQAAIPESGVNIRA